MQTGVIVRRNPDQFIPDSYIKLALENNPDGYGAAVLDGEEGLKTSSGGKDDLSIDFVKQTMEAFPNRPITFYFYHADGAVNESCVFPQILLEDDTGPKLAVFVDANMPGFVKKDSSITPETHFVDDWLRAKLGAIGELAEGDLEAVMKICSGDDFRKKILGQAVSRGAITLMSDKSSLSFALGDTCREYPWGWVSNHYGFEMTKKEPEAPAKPKNMFAKKAKTVDEPGPKSDPTPVSKVAEQLMSSTKNIPKYSVKKGSPQGALSRKDRKGWYGTRIGYYPVGGDKGVEIEYYVDQTGKLLTWGQLKNLGLDAVGLPKLNNPPRQEGKDTEPDNIDGNVQHTNPQPQVNTEILPVMSPATREYINKLMESPEIKKIISEKGDLVATAEQAKAIEAQFADFTKQLGGKYSFDVFLRLPYEELYKLGQLKLQGLAMFAWTCSNMLLSMKTKKTEASVPEVKQEETPPAPKKNMFAKKTAA